MPTTPNGLVIEDVTVGQGAVAAAGQKVTVHYTGWLTNGTKFDSEFVVFLRGEIAKWTKLVREANLRIE